MQLRWIEDYVTSTATKGTVYADIDTMYELLASSSTKLLSYL